MEVEREFMRGVLDAFAIRVIDLRPAGEAGFGEVAQVVSWQDILIIIDADSPLGAGTDETHVAPHNVE